MFDSFGDGWNGGAYTITNLFSAEQYSGTLSDGSTGTDFWFLASGCYSFEAGGGYYPGEISWDLVGLDQGNLSGGAPELISFSLGGAECFLGCLDVSACN
jgi:hypothetical protein